MAREINLIPKREESTPEQIRLQAFVKWGLPLILIVYVFMLALVLVFAYSINQQLADADKNILDEKSKINALRRNESIYLLLKQKTLALNKILPDHYPYPMQLEYFKSLNTTGAIVKAIEIADSGQVLLTLDTSDSTVVDTLVTEILKAAVKRFRNVELQGIQYTPGGSIILRLNLDMQTGKS